MGTLGDLYPRPAAGWPLVYTSSRYAKMRCLLVAVVAVVCLCGCAEVPIWNAPAAPQYAYENPMLVSAGNVMRRYCMPTLSACFA